MTGTKAHRRGFAVALVLLLVDLVLAAAASAGVPVGGEFQVNVQTVQRQSYPDVAKEGDGDFVIVWSSAYQDGDPPGIFFRRFDAAGSAVSTELQVNSYTTSIQDYPVVAAQSGGAFVVVWQSQQDGDGYGIFGQLFSSVGTKEGGELQINSHTIGSQRFPALAAEANGDFVVTWNSPDQDGSLTGIFGRRFDSSGAAQAAEFQVNSYTAAAQEYSAVTMSAAGSFIVVWASNGQEGDSRGIFGQRFDESGAPQGVEFQVNSYTPSNQRYPDVAADDLGGFVVAWESLTQDGSLFGVFAQRFASTGNRQGGEFRVNVNVASNQRDASIAAESDGDFVVSWHGLDADGFGVFFRRWNAAGVAQTGEVQINVVTVGSQIRSSAAIDDNGDFVIAWQSYHDGSTSGVFARRGDSVVPPTATVTPTRTITSTATPTRTPTATSTATATPTSSITPSRTASPTASPTASLTHTPTTTLTPSITSTPTRTPTASPSPSVTLTPTPTATGAGAILDIDDDGTVEPLTDGVLVLRFFFGFTGGPLINSAVDPDCNRCSAALIEDYLESIESQLEIDGASPPPAPLTDGLLILRYLFGFTGGALTNGAVGQGCTRCDATLIEPYLAGLVG